MLPHASTPLTALFPAANETSLLHPQPPQSTEVHLHELFNTLKHPQRLHFSMLETDTSV